MAKRELSMLPDGTILRFRYERGKYDGVEYHATINDGRIEVNGSRYSPNGAAREVDRLIRGEEGHEGWHPYEKWEWNPGDGNWKPIRELTE